MRIRLAKGLRRALLACACAAFACKLLIPAGYMPAALGSGGPVTLCPGGLPAGLLEAVGAHAARGGAQDRPDHDESALWEHCSLGTLAATPALTGAPVLAVPAAAPASTSAAETGIAPQTRLVAFRARAPPRRLS